MSCLESTPPTVQGPDMCGVVGIVGDAADSVASDRWLDEALEHLAVRGPDASARWDAQGVRLGHRRLSIRDLSDAGAQPMASASGRCHIAYNGEIYGTERLADQLKRGGWIPRGHSDTEVVLEALEGSGLQQAPERAEQTLAGFNGMFALALWDTKTRTLLLARDPVGIKPLYVAELSDGLAFCSEPGPLYKLKAVNRRLDVDALSLFLTLGVMPAPMSLGQGVRQLRPGEMLWWRDGAVNSSFFARIPTPARPHYDPADPCTEDELERLLMESVTDQLVSDVPVGVLLSGGVDSSLVAAAAVRAGHSVKTFSVVHENPAYDERLSARAVAEHIGSEHYELEMPAGGLTEDELHDLALRTGDPFGDTSALAMRRVSGLVRQHVSVALSGDGGDELFAGYDRYHLAARLRRLSSAPAPARAAAVAGWKALDRLAPVLSRFGQVRRLARAIHVTTRSPGDQAFGTKTLMWPDEVARLVRPELRSLVTLGDHVESRVGHAPATPGPWFLHMMEQHTVLPDQMCVKVDRMSMAESLEIRPVLLDHRIVHAAARTAFRDKYGGGEGKSVLKRIARRWVPAKVVDRPKKGFAVPVLAYGGRVLEEAGRWALMSEESPLCGVFGASARSQLFDELHRPPPGRSPEDSAFRLVHRRWQLVMLALSMQNLGIQADP
ncbi:MAG: asparagine synthase (glutamine-hydrolyzing) [Myxococcota bacterium]